MTTEWADQTEHGRTWRYVARPRKLHLEAEVRPATPKMRYTLCALYVLQFYTRPAMSPGEVQRFCRACRRKARRGLGW